MERKRIGMGRIFTRAQWRIFFGCFLAYATAYVARLNLSAALPDLSASMDLTDAQSGMFQTGFAFIYACGQLVNGSLADRISARKYILAGMLASAACNALVGSAQSYGVLLLGWCLNGVAQSMLWTPIVKLMATWYHGHSRNRVSFGMSMTLVVGHLAAWAISGYMATLFGWRMSFFIPAAVIGGMSLIAFAILRDQPKTPEEAGAEPEEQAAHASEAKPTSSVMPIPTMLFRTGLLFILICCVTNGFVRDGVIPWAPTIIGTLSGGASGNSVLVSLIIPVLNLIGVLLGRRIYNMIDYNARRCTALLMAACSVLAILILAGSRSMFICALLLGMTCAATYGVNPMLTTLIPMEYDRAGRVALLAGVVDCFIYLGSSLAGIATGLLSDSAGWNAVFVVWCATAAAGTVMAFVSLRDRKRTLEWGKEA